MKKVIAALLFFSILTVGCSNNKNNIEHTNPTLNQIKNEQETQNQNQGNNSFESKDDIENEIKSKVVINTYYEEPASLEDKNTIIINGLMKGEFVEVVVEGEIKDFKHVEIKWDETQNTMIETRIINEFDKLTNNTIVIKTYLPDGIPSEKIEWKTIAGETCEFIIAENNLK